MLQGKFIIDYVYQYTEIGQTSPYLQHRIRLVTDIIGQEMNIFLRGLIALLPLSGTIYLLYWLFTVVEGVSGQFISFAFGPKVTIPGIGIVFSFVVIYLFGLLLGLVPFQYLLKKIQTPFRNIPLVKSIYSALEDLLQFFDNGGNKNQGRVVKIHLGENKDINLVGLLTSTSPHDATQSDGVLYAVYVPVSYQIGGYTLFVRPEQITYLEMGVEELMKSSLTAWVKK